MSPCGAAIIFNCTGIYISANSLASPNPPLINVILYMRGCELLIQSQFPLFWLQFMAPVYQQSLHINIHLLNLLISLRVWFKESSDPFHSHKLLPYLGNHMFVISRSQTSHPHTATRSSGAVWSLTFYSRTPKMSTRLHQLSHSGLRCWSISNRLLEVLNVTHTSQLSHLQAAHLAEPGVLCTLL